MRVAFLQANQCWALVFGDSLVDLDGQRLFNKVSELVWALNLKGLRMGKGGVVEVIV